MFKKIEIVLHSGTNEIHFGMDRETVRSILGTPFHTEEASVFEFDDIKIDNPAKDTYFENEFQIHYDANLQVEYLEFHGNEAEHLNVFLDDVNVFKTPVPELIEKVKSAYQTDYDHSNEELPYSFIFKQLDLSFWRQELVDNLGNEFFWTIGIGKKGYY
ncbi:hypothetical protein [Flavobacterium sp.]|uniref:hypothetical protein n=1 Tax=Flavobacterium sp. TaxID=239 RepID=UPI0035270C35